MSKSTGEVAYFSTGVEGENRLDVLDVTDVGGAAADIFVTDMVDDI
ncbi:MAG: hypothetical protein ACLRTA_09150 [Clostridia bacterium]